MLEGMAPAQARAVRAAAGSLLLYTPVVDDAEYVGRDRVPLAPARRERGDRRTSCASLFSITPGSPEWQARARPLRDRGRRRARRSRPRRGATQDRRTEQRGASIPMPPFANEPDTDFTLAPEPRVDRRTTSPRAALPDVAAPGRRHRRDRRASSRAPSRGRGVGGPRRTADRRRVLDARRRGDGRAPRAARSRSWPHETGKTVREGDPEVSEAIDMARWAGDADASPRRPRARRRAVARRAASSLVAAPWNFPYAIPANGVRRRARGRATRCS